MAPDPLPCNAVHFQIGEYLRRRLPAETLVAIRHHLAECPRCAATFEEERAFSAIVGGTDAPAPANLLVGVIARVHAEPCVLPAFRVRPLDVLLAFWGTAALLGIVFGLMSLSVVAPAVVGLVTGDVPLDNAFVAGVTPVLAWSVPGIVILTLATAVTRTFLVRRAAMVN